MKIKPAKKEPPPDRDEMIARVKTLVRESRAHTVSRRELEAVTGIKDHHVRRHFGSHSALIRACGLTPYSRQLGASDEDLLTAMHEAFTAAGGVLGGKRFESTCRYGRQAYKSRWRRWSSALSAYRVWLEAHHPDSPLLPALAASSLPDDEVIAWEACGGARFGAPLPLPGLQHAPTNKMGVVFLFGALAPALGYTVESLGTAFPDCVAKRRLQEPEIGRAHV